MIKFLHLSRRKPTAQASPLVSTLDRVRDMRQHSDWEPLTPPSSIQQRADRLAEAKEHIKIPPLGNERETRQTVDRYFHSPEFWRPVLYSIAVFTVLALAMYAFGPEGTIKSKVRQASFVYSGMAYTDLTESDADRLARRSLASTGLDSSEWLKLNSHISNGATIITFRHEYGRSTIVRVKVQLEPGERILCTVDPR